MTGEPRCAVGVPNVGLFGDPLLLVELAVAAEQHGWDGFFVWDHLLYHDQRWDVADPVAVIAAVAARTARPRRRAGGPVPGCRADLVDRSAGLVARQPGERDAPGPPGAADADPSPALIPLTAASLRRCTRASRRVGTNSRRPPRSTYLPLGAVAASFAAISSGMQSW